MIRWSCDLLYGAITTEFKSSFGVDESVRRLSAVTERSMFSLLDKQKAVGRVDKTRVSLQRVIPMVRNSFKPFFIGQFVEEDGRVILKGQFTMHRCAKIFMSFWFGFCLFWTLLAIALLVARDPKKWWLPFFGLEMISAGVAIVWTGKWFARNDIAWLSEVIRNALSDEPPKHHLSAT